MRNSNREKFVIVIDQDLSTGLMANAAAVLSMTIGRLVKDAIGPDLPDQSGEVHLGITSLPINVLRADEGKIKQIRDEAAQVDNLLLVDFSNVAQTCKNYNEYQTKLLNTRVEDLRYLGIALFGDSTRVARLTGNLGLLR